MRAEPSHPAGQVDLPRREVIARAAFSIKTCVVSTFTCGCMSHPRLICRISCSPHWLTPPSQANENATSGARGPSIPRQRSGSAPAGSAT